MSVEVDSAYTYNVRVEDAPDDAIALDYDNAVNETFASGEQFKIGIPVSNLDDSSQYRIITSCNAELPYVNLYGDPDNPSAERFVLLSEEWNKTVEKEMILSVSNPESKYGPHNVIVVVAVAAFIFVLAALSIRRLLRENSHRPV